MRKAVLLAAVALVLIGAGWTALWFYAAHEAGRQFDAWLKSEDDQGRSWTCPNRSIAGYPFALTVGCTGPTFAGQAMGQTVRGTVAALTAEAALVHPKRIAVSLAAPLTYTTSDGQAVVKATWSSLGVDLDGLPDMHAVTLHGSDLSVHGTFGETGRQAGNALALDAIFDLARQDGTLDFNVAVKGTAVPPIDELLGGQAPVDIALVGRLDRADVGDARTPEEAIERWRQAGGRIALAPSSLTRDGASVTGSGTLGLDDAHRPQGRLDASFVGLEPVLKRYGISGNLAAAGSLLSALFGGKPQAPTTPGALSLPINFQNGRLGIGPIRTQIALPPLY